MNTTVSYYINSSDTTSKNYAEFYQIVEFIRTNETLKKYTDWVRSSSDKKEFDERKRNLPMICYSGIFSYRNKNSLQQYSNIIIVDLDKFDNYEGARSFIENVCKLNPYVMSAWISASNKGVKIAILHDNTNPDYNAELYYKTSGMFISSEFITDDKCIDLCRACFLCYDSEIYYNPNSKVFHFEHSEGFTQNNSNKYGSGITGVKFTHLSTELEANKLFQELWKDKTLISYVDKYWTKYGETIKEGNRSTTVLKRATALCRYGVIFDNAFEYLKRLFTAKGLSEKEIWSSANYAYNKNREFFGVDREDLYNRKVQNTINYNNKIWNK